MQPTKQALAFPRDLPNDIEEFSPLLPKKFPHIVKSYEDMVAKYWDKPEELGDHCQALLKELFDGLEKIKQDFEISEDRSADFIFDIEQRLLKLNTFRFWIVNYALCSGPLHTFYVEFLKDIAHELVDKEDPEEEAQELKRIQRLLLQGDYADLYLKNSLQAVGIKELIHNNSLFADTLNKIQNAVNSEQAEEHIDALMRIAHENQSDLATLYELMPYQITYRSMTSSNYELHRMITKVLKFKDTDETRKLSEHGQLMKIKSIILNHPDLKDYSHKILDTIEQGEAPEVYIDELMNKAEELKANDKIACLYELMSLPLNVSRVRRNNSGIHAGVLNALEFYEDNVRLQEEHDRTKHDLEKLFAHANQILNTERYDDLVLAYKMCLKFKEFKDDFGSIDPEIIPFWMHQVFPALEKAVGAPPRSHSIGPGASFYYFPWIMPEHLLKRMYTPDQNPFDINEVMFGGKNDNM